MAQQDQFTGLPPKPGEKPIGYGSNNPFDIMNLLDVNMAGMNPVTGQIPANRNVVIRRPGPAGAQVGVQQENPIGITKPAQNTSWLEGKPSWNIYGQQPGKPTFATTPGAQPGKPNYNIFGNQPPTRKTITNPAQPSPQIPTPSQKLAAGPDIGFKDPLTGEFIFNGDLFPIYDPETGELIQQSYLPMTDEQIIKWAGQRQNDQTISPMKTMQDQFPMLTDDRMTELYLDWLADQKPDRMEPTEEPTTTVIYEPYPMPQYTASSFSGGKGGSGYKNFFKALYWRVGE